MTARILKCGIFYSNWVKILIMSKYLWLWPFIIFIALSGVFHFSSANIPDLDSFYYIRLADFYKNQGLFNAGFSWLPYTVINSFSSSLWYGFGVILIPFTVFSDLIFGVKIAGFIFTAAFLSICYVAFKRRGIAGAPFWPLFVFFAAPNVSIHLLMTRPQTISLLLAVPLLFVISRRMPLGIFAVSFLIAWIHLNFAWIPILVAGIFVSLKYILEKKFAWKKFLWASGGVALGFLLRPDPIGAVKLFYVQVLKQILEKQGGLPLLFGAENLPIGSSALFQHFGLFILIWAAAIVAWLYLIFYKSRPDFSDYWKNNDVFLSAAMSLSIIFFLLTIAVARRAYDFWVLFGVVGIAVVFTYLYLNFRKTPQLKWLKFFIAALFIFMMINSGTRTINNMQNNAYKPNLLEKSAFWLKENSNEGDVVFNVHWSHFSPLFFWNQKNYYVGGLDPIFQYEYNPSLYWKFHYLSADIVTSKTCGADACTESMLEDTYDVLKKDFNAKYIVLDGGQNPAVNSFLEKDPKFEKKFTEGSYNVYSIK